jgi:hypothetical protein
MFSAGRAGRPEHGKALEFQWLWLPAALTRSQGQLMTCFSRLAEARENGAMVTSKARPSSRIIR